MSKKYKGHELIKAITDGEIESGTHIKVHAKNYSVDYWFYGNWFGKENYKEPLDNIELFLCNRDCIFELIEEDMDIQRMEEFNSEYTMNNVEMQLQDKINQILLALKQLDRKIREER